MKTTEGYYIEHNGEHYQSVFSSNESECSQTHTTLDDAFDYMVNTCNIEPDEIIVVCLDPELFNRHSL